MPPSHDEEGLNVMVYNRCVGTRYCSNNCPYKVRRFNFLDYNKRPLSALKGPFYPTPLIAQDRWRMGFVELVEESGNPTAGGMRQDDEWDLIKMVEEPGRHGADARRDGEMHLLHPAHPAGGDRAEGQSRRFRRREAEGIGRHVPKTACQQACPAGAIVFGDITDPDSTVSQLKAQQRNYSVLDALLTKPRTTYLARVRNPNPAMPDYHEPSAASFEEYEKKMGNPFNAKAKHR